MLHKAGRKYRYQHDWLSVKATFRVWCLDSHLFHGMNSLSKKRRFFSPPDFYIFSDKEYPYPRFGNFIVFLLVCQYLQDRYLCVCMCTVPVFVRINCCAQILAVYGNGLYDHLGLSFGGGGIPLCTGALMPPEPFCSEMPKIHDLILCGSTG